MADDLFPNEPDCDHETQDDDKVGYGKPPKNTRFQKGTSGNPSGRPKKPRDFDHELIREAESSVIIKENGRKKRVTKHKVVLKQFVNQAMTGNSRAAQSYLDRVQQARERIALASGPTLDDLMKCSADDLSDDDLARIIQEGKKAKVNNV